MTRPLTLFTGQWADLSLEVLAEKARGFGYDGLELASWGDHFDVRRALVEDDYVAGKWRQLRAQGLGCFAISNHLVGQAVCDRIDERHRAILPERVWGEGNPVEVNRRAAEEMKDTARAARRFFDAAPEELRPALEAVGRTVVTGFTGSSIWPWVYAFPPLRPGQIEGGFADFGRRWRPILDVFDQEDVDFALEVHPTEIAFDIASARRALEAVDHHPRFGFNFDPSHFGYQNVDYLRFLDLFADRIFHVHVKDVWWDDRPAEAGVFGGHLEFGDGRRGWDFRSPGRGRIDFEGIHRRLLLADYRGPLSVEWEDALMEREHGAAEACAFVRRLLHPPSARAFDAAFEERERR
ncbi:MAG: sugar phosphate isomerase/epimerase [Planctomycetes bacterium]|nr:sugar phosphate isomerase/epimerase [Planctomycetota bacterium]